MGMQPCTAPRVFAVLLLLMASLLACGGGGGSSSGSTPPPQMVITAPTKVTEGDKRTASATAISGATYTWTIQNGTITAGNGTSNIAYTVGTPGSLKLTVAAASTTATATMDVLPLPIINSFQATPSTIYVGDSTQLSADFINGAGNIQPGNLAITSGVPITVSPVVDTIYTLNDTNEAGGNAVFAILVKVLPLDATPTPVITAPSSVTAGQAGYVASVPAVTGATYAWTITTATVTAGTGTDTITFTPGASGTVGLSCVVTNPHSTPSSPGTATAAILAGPITPVITAPASVNAFQTGYTASTPAQSGCTFAWTLTGGTVTAGDGTPSITFTPGASGTMGFSCIATNGAGTASPAGTASSTITPLPLPAITSFTVNPTALGSGDSVVFSATFSNGTGVITPGSFSITSGSTTTSSAILTSQVYTLTVSNLAGDTATATASVAVLPGVMGDGGTMNDRRQDHSATLLASGKLLLAGGLNDPFISIITDLYDPATGVFGTTGNLPGQGTYHAATALLPNGKVLIAGGEDGAGAVPTAVLYDPLAGTFVYTGSMSEARTTHTATLLPNGLVLIAGGDTQVSATAELYDPATGTFSPTGSPSVARYYATAALLPNGTVLLAGGGSLACEIYDPTAGTFSPTGSMSVIRYRCTATLLPNGQVLVVGGSTSGNYPGATTQGSAELYDPTTGLFTATGSLITPRFYHTATLLPDGKVLIAGGADAPLNLKVRSEIYDPAAGTFGPTGLLAQGRAGHTATLLPDGKVLLAGGYDPTIVSEPWLNSAELYDPQDAAPGFPVALYASVAFAFTAGTPIATVSPLGSGATSWTISPALPAGLSLDPSTGAITGTPTAPSAAQAYVVTASNGTHSSSTYLWIEVAP